VTPVGVAVGLSVEPGVRLATGAAVAFRGPGVVGPDIGLTDGLDVGATVGVVLELGVGLAIGVAVLSGFSRANIIGVVGLNVGLDVEATAGLVTELDVRLVIGLSDKLKSVGRALSVQRVKDSSLVSISVMINTMSREPSTQPPVVVL
jgi:hypothetical protein